MAGEFYWSPRVYQEDTDAAGVVYYANYLKYMERARTEWLQSMCFRRAHSSAHGYVFAVIAAKVNSRSRRD